VRPHLIALSSNAAQSLAKIQPSGWESGLVYACTWVHGVAALPTALISHMESGLLCPISIHMLPFSSFSYYHFAIAQNENVKPKTKSSRTLTWMTTSKN
jgi:hypothetical protein